jgi:hypothetical protein
VRSDREKSCKKKTTTTTTTTKKNYKQTNKLTYVPRSQRRDSSECSSAVRQSNAQRDTSLGVRNELFQAKKAEEEKTHTLVYIVNLFEPFAFGVRHISIASPCSSW